MARLSYHISPEVPSDPFYGKVKKLSLEKHRAKTRWWGASSGSSRYLIASRPCGCCWGWTPAWATATFALFFGLHLVSLDLRCFPFDRLRGDWSGQLAAILAECVAVASPALLTGEVLSGDLVVIQFNVWGRAGYVGDGDRSRGAIADEDAAGDEERDRQQREPPKTA